MADQERIEASRELVDFVRKFTLLSERQLMGIRSYMADTVTQVMASVTRIDSATVEKKRQATEILLGDGAVRTSASEIAESERSDPNGQPAKRTKTLESELLRSSGLFSKHMEAISTLDDEVRSVLYQMIGALSADDVMGQRLWHVITSLAAMAQGVADFMKGYPEKTTREGVANFRNSVLAQVYKSYTMVEERDVFHEVFGVPVRSGMQAS